MAVINVPGTEPWIVARWALEELVDEAKTELTNQIDIDRLDRAVALDGLHFKRVEVKQACRLAAVLLTSSQRLVHRLSEEASGSSLDESFIVALGRLQVLLRTFLVQFGEVTGQDRTPGG